MDNDAKKTTLRMIPYGIYILTGEDAEGNVTAATVNWVTQTSFDPPLLAVGVKADSHSYELIKKTGAFALNMLGKGQQGMAFDFFKPAQKEGNKINGQGFRTGENGAPILNAAQASVECKIVDIVERGDHHIVVGEVTEASVATPPEGRPDAAILEMKELGDNVFYGG